MEVGIRSGLGLALKAWSWSERDLAFQVLEAWTHSWIWQ